MLEAKIIGTKHTSEIFTTSESGLDILCVPGERCYVEILNILQLHLSLSFPVLFIFVAVSSLRQHLEHCEIMTTGRKQRYINKKETLTD